MLDLGQDVLDAMTAHGEETYPRECCGLLVGRSDGTTRTALEAHRAGNLNTERAHDRYSLDPGDWQRIDADARARGLDIVGIYHSHPDHPSRPSRTDFEHAWEGYSYVVVEVAKGRAASWRTWTKSETDFDPEPARVRCTLSC